MKITIGVAVIAAALLFTGYRTVFGSQKIVVDTSAQSKKIQEYANPDSFITPYQLNELMADEKSDVIVVGSLNPKKLDSPISGSFTMWRSAYSAGNDVYPYGGMRNKAEEMENILASYGATKKSIIVVYASNKHHDAARLWWQIKLLGHKDVRFLDGGLNAWKGAGYETGNANPKVKNSGYKAPKATSVPLATLDMVKKATTSSDWLIIDTRTDAENDGSKTKGGAAGPGTIPASLHINWTNASNEDTTLKTAAELKAIYGDAIKGKKVIAYCQSGVRSAHTYLVLTQILGAEEVYNYDGSWIEWSYEYYENNNSVAIINGK
jgi:thiosulfate/3-mercaptopyruvate sulfurtransferase